MASYNASPFIRHRLIDGNVIILDLRSGEYKILDDVATAMWLAVLAGSDRPCCIEQLANTFAAAPAKVAADLEAFLHEAEVSGLLTSQLPTAPAIGRPAPRWPRSCLASGAWWSLFATTRMLAGNGFADAYAKLSACAKPKCDDGDGFTRLARAERAFSLAENFFVIPSAPQDCLPRSLSLYRFLLMAGVSADHVIGVRRFTFQAHAWVECAGRVVFDSPDFVRCYTELARM